MKGFIAGFLLASALGAGLVYAQSWQQQQQTDALNNLSNNSNYQRQYQGPRYGDYTPTPLMKPPC